MPKFMWIYWEGGSYGEPQELWDDKPDVKERFKAKVLSAVKGRCAGQYDPKYDRIDYNFEYGENHFMARCNLWEFELLRVPVVKARRKRGTKTCR